MTESSKRVVFTMGGKGGVGKTAVILVLAEWFEANSIPITLLDLDSENKAAGSLKHYFPSSAHPVNIHTHAGLDAFVIGRNLLDATVTEELRNRRSQQPLHFRINHGIRAVEMGIGHLNLACARRNVPGVADCYSFIKLALEKPEVSCSAPFTGGLFSG